MENAGNVSIRRVKVNIHRDKDLELSLQTADN